MKNEMIQNRLDWFAVCEGMLNTTIEEAARKSGEEYEVINSCFDEDTIWVEFPGEWDLYIQLSVEKYEELI